MLSGTGYNFAQINSKKKKKQIIEILVPWDHDEIES